MKKGVFTIAENGPLTPTVYRLRLAGDTSAVTAPGQFVNIALPGFYLRRPISVCDCGEGELTLIYKTVGKGTGAMAAMGPGTSLELLTGLGNGFDTALSGDAPLLLGGGIGSAPLYLLAKRLRAAGRTVRAVLGFNTAEEVFYEDAFRALGCEVTVTTADGSCGAPGFVTDALPEEYSFYYAYGPKRVCKDGPVFRKGEILWEI